MSDTTTKGRITIDQDKCTGCGQCVNACHAGALAMIDGKAHLVDENHCDGLGVCIGECPFGAISFSGNGDSTTKSTAPKTAPKEKPLHEETLACGCPGHMNQVFHTIPKKEPKKPATVRSILNEESLPPLRTKSELGAWPIQFTLDPPDSHTVPRGPTS